MKMKILTQLWESFKAGKVEPSTMSMLAQWDAKRKLYVVGNPPDPTNPATRTIDDGNIPANWHQCFYYASEEIPASRITEGGHKWIRCRNLAGPGFKPSFCTFHMEQETALYKARTEPVVPDVVVMQPVYRYCKWGDCIVRVFTGAEYCETHKELVAKFKTSDNGRAHVDPLEDCGCMGYCDIHLNQTAEDAAAEIEFANLPEDIDEDFGRKMTWGQLRYRRSRKTIPVQQQETLHFKLEMRGSRDEIDLFHAMLHLCDTDYPLDPFRKSTVIPAKCDNCGGYIWQNAIISPPDIKAAAKQANITVKIRTYLPESSCKKKPRSANA